MLSFLQSLVRVTPRLSKLINGLAYDPNNHLFQLWLVVRRLCNGKCAEAGKRQQRDELVAGVYHRKPRADELE